MTGGSPPPGPATPVAIVDPTVDREALSLSADERSALRGRLIEPGHLLLALGLLFGVLTTGGVIKATTGIPIDRGAEIHSVREAALRAALDDAGGPSGNVAVCFAVEGRADPEGRFLQRFDDLGPLVLPASECLSDDLFARAPTRFVSVRHVLWRWGGRAVVTAGSDQLRRYFLQRRRDGWHVIAVRPA